MRLRTSKITRLLSLLLLVSRSDALQNSRQSTARVENTQTDPTFVHNRRKLLLSLPVASTASLAATLSLSLSSVVVHAAEPDDDAELSSRRPSQRPFAPTQALVPAMQQRILLDRIAGLCQRLQNESDLTRRSAILNSLKLLLDRPPTLSPSAYKFAMGATKRYTTSSSLDASLMSSTLVSGAYARAAMNYYTANLRFAESYLLTASPAEKSRLLRTQGQFPDVKQVITADLDLRDLYRNLVQTTMDDLAAEVYTAVDGSTATTTMEDLDAPEILRLSTEAATAFDKWLSFIDDKDLEKARILASAALESN